MQSVREMTLSQVAFTTKMCYWILRIIQTICHTVPGYTKEVQNPETHDLYPIACTTYS